MRPPVAVQLQKLCMVSTFFLVLAWVLQVYYCTKIFFCYVGLRVVATDIAASELREKRRLTEKARNGISYSKPIVSLSTTM